MGNFGVCTQEYKSTKIENIENGYWIKVGPADRLSVDREEPLPDSRNSSLGFILANSLMIMQVHDQDLIDAGLKPGSWISHVADSIQLLEEEYEAKRKIPSVVEFRKRIRNKTSFGLVVRPPESTDTHEIIRGEPGTARLDFIVHPSTLRLISETNKELNNKRVTHINGVPVLNFAEFQDAIQQPNYWITLSRDHSLTLKEIITEIERWCDHAPLYRSTLETFEGELQHLIKLTSDVIVSVKTELSNQGSLVSALPTPPVPSAIDRQTLPDLWALKQIELTIKELRSFHELPVLSFRHVDRVEELEVITEQNCQIIEKVLNDMKCQIIQSEECKRPRAVIEKTQEKYDSIAKLYEEVYRTYKKIKAKLPPADDAGRDRQRVHTKIKNRIDRRNNEKIVDRPPNLWPPAGTDRGMRDYMRASEEELEY